MKASVAGSVIAACVVAFSLSVVAQEKEKPPAKEHSMTGCLQKGTTAETFVVTNTEPKGPKLIGIVESKEQPGPPRRPQDHHHRCGRPGQGSRERKDQARQG